MLFRSSRTVGENRSLLVTHTGGGVQRRGVVLCAVVAAMLGAGSTAAAGVIVPKPIVPLASETGLGSLFASLPPQVFSSTFWPSVGFAGTIESRVYVNASFDVVTFIWDIVLDPGITAGSEVDAFTWISQIDFAVGRTVMCVAA